MSKLDELIEEALRDEDHEIIAATSEQGWFQLGLSQFSGKLGWVTWVIMITQAILFLAGVWCAIYFFNATEPLSAIKWGISGAVLILIATQLKLSLMPKMQADRVLRELKRLELILVSQRY